jgi:predicted negative regulator of RcsB-dependent stress response
VDRITRKGLKRDKFALEVQHGLEYVTGHRRVMLRWGAIGAAVVLLVVGFFLYRRHEASVRQQAVEVAMRVETATIGPPANEFVIAYPTEAERNKAALKAWTDLATKYSGTNEGIVAEYFLGGHAAEDGNIQAAQKHFQTVVDSGQMDYGSLAKLALAQLYGTQGKVAQGEKLIQSVIDHPTVLVSKEAAIIALAHLIAPTDAGRARKLLEPLRGSERAQVSQQVLRALSELPK